jgi:hypothetical protein
MPEKRQIEALRRAVRYLLAIERVEAKKQQHRLSKDQLDQLKERRRTEEAAAESALRELYVSVWLPRVETGKLEIEKIEKGGRPLQATGIHERIMEILTSLGAQKVFSTVTPNKVVERMKLEEAVSPGEPLRLGIRLTEALEAFYRDIEPPRLESSAALKIGVSKGVEKGVLAYMSGSVPNLGPDGKFQVSRDRVNFGCSLAEDEVDLDSGFVILPLALPEAPLVGERPVLVPEGGRPSGAEPISPGAPTAGSVPPAGPGQLRHEVELAFSATRDQVFKAFPSIANLADKSDGGKVEIRVKGSSTSGYDPS